MKGYNWRWHWIVVPLAILLVALKVGVDRSETLPFAQSIKQVAATTNITSKIMSTLFAERDGGAAAIPYTQHSFRTQQDLRLHIQAHESFPVVIERPVDTHRENACFMVLCRNEDLYSLLETIQSVQDRFNTNFNYDWVFLNDKNFTEEFMVSTASLITEGSVKFGHISPEEWGFPSWIDEAHAREVWQSYDDDVVYGKSESYRHMCRYFSGFFYNHPLMQTYQYYWRIEPGVKYYCDINYDVFQFMVENDLSYGFTLSMFEYSETIPTLWDTFKEYLDREKVEAGPLIEFVQNDDTDKSYNLCHFWTNFEIADMSIFRSNKYKRFFDHLDAKGGFYYERWGDAPVHSLFISAFLDPEQVWWFQDMGYFHAPYVQCPKDPQFRLQGRCTCNPNIDFSHGELSCTNHFLRIWDKSIESGSRKTTT